MLKPSSCSISSVQPVCPALWQRFPLAALLCWLTFTPEAMAVDYLKQIKPIFAERCYACHGALKRESGLRLDTAEQIRKGGDGGAAVVPGKSAESPLLHRIAATDLSERMPPEGKPLTVEQIALIRAWVESGATAPPDERPDDDPMHHWAFVAPRRIAVPPIPTGHAWYKETTNPIDAFLARDHARHGLTPQSRAERSLWLRRAYLDVIGLPPTLDEMERFQRDSAPDAYERVVDRLLASPEFGERWARHWMDLWRYSDWYGLGDQLRDSQKHIWHWRDWIVESVNDDVGYDRMVLEMLAADELEPINRAALRANGFLARNYYLFNRTTWLDNVIEHTSKAFLGLTMNCARCHDHKYDPLAQNDYYALRAILEPHQIRLDQLPGEADFERNGLPRAFDAHPEAPTYLFVRGDDKNPDKSRTIAPATPVAFTFGKLDVQPVALPAAAHNPALHPFVLENHLRQSRSAIEQSERQLLVAARRVEGILRAGHSPVVTATAETNSTGHADGFVRDSFQEAKPLIWEFGGGEWAYRNARLIQSRTGNERGVLRSIKAHPADFVAKASFRITGGEQWKSVGFCFDVADNHEVLVYLSAFEPSKLQVALGNGAEYQYPSDGFQARPVRLNETYELAVAVRGGLLNVAVNGEHALSYYLPNARRPGRYQLITYSASAEFLSFELDRLPADHKLVPARNAASPSDIELARAELAIAEKAVAAAKLRPAALRSAWIADVAKSRGEAPDRIAQVVAEAARHEAILKLARAEEELAKAELELRKAEASRRKDVEAKRNAARDTVEKAKQAKPGTEYTSLRGSLKALEGPDEKEESRHAPFPAVSTGRRLALARWIVDRNNPLTARVLVNHIWLRHFGQPIVESVADFGRRGARPTNQDLLDWLAVELVENGWSMKRLHRLMLTSQSYRMTSSNAGAAATNLADDRENRFLWRMNSVRMQSQVVRDSLLALAGRLEKRMYGPTVDQSKEWGVPRRTLYFKHSRDDVNPFLETFDNANILECYRRAESILPQQALAMANSELTGQCAESIARRLEPSAGSDDARFVELAFAGLLGAAPSREEKGICLDSLALLRRTLEERKHPAAVAKSRADFVQALLNHNDFLTIR